MKTHLFFISLAVLFITLVGIDILVRQNKIELPVVFTKSQTINGVEYGSCPKTQTQKYMDEAVPMIREMLDLGKLASSSPRIGLAVPIRDLQNLRVKADALKPPTCYNASMVHSAFLTTLDSMIDVYISFLGQEKDVVVSSKADTLSKNLSILTSSIAELTNEMK